MLLEKDALWTMNWDFHRANFGVNSSTNKTDESRKLDRSSSLFKMLYKTCSTFSIYFINPNHVEGFKESSKSYKVRMAGESPKEINAES